MKNLICAFFGAFGAFIASLFSGWDASLITLLIFMLIDYITGLLLAGVFHKSTKSDSGALESKAGWKGLCRKGVVLFIVIVANRIDIIIGTSYVRDAVCITFICNETISILENAGLMGIPIPKVVTNAINILKKESEDENNG